MPAGQPLLKVFTTLLAGQTLDSLLQSLLPHDHAPATGQTPASQDTPAADAQTAPRGSGPALTGSVNLTMPVSAWLGRTDNPGELAGYGAADAGTCRDLAARLATGNTQWCITLTDPHGNAVGHGCARAGPGPPDTGERTGWLAMVRITPIETGTCSHRRQSPATSPPTACATSSKPEAAAAATQDAAGPPSDATTTTRSPTTRADARASVICTLCAAGITGVSKVPAGSSTSHSQAT